MIHRVPKPSNIVVSETGDVKVLDFGLARITDVAVAVGAVLTALTSARRGNLYFLKKKPF